MKSEKRTNNVTFHPSLVTCHWSLVIVLESKQFLKAYFLELTYFLEFCLREFLLRGQDNIGIRLLREVFVMESLYILEGDLIYILIN